MTREEQIVEAAKNSEKQMGFDVPRGVISPYTIGFLEGAVWADEHPDLYNVTRKAVERERKHLIDKVCKWLNENTEDYTECIYDSDTDDYDDEDNLHFAVASNYDYKKDFIEAFRKAMED
jgi:hypothetical protein